MAYKIGDACISCACADECPVECISAGDDIYVINADECIDVVHVIVFVQWKLHNKTNKKAIQII